MVLNGLKKENKQIQNKMPHMAFYQLGKWCACDKKPKRTLNLLKLYSLFYKKEVQRCVAPRVIGEFHEGLFTCHNPLSAWERRGGREE